MIKLSIKAECIYKNIDFYRRCENLSNTYNHNQRLENYSNDEVAKVISDLGYISKYSGKEDFFKVEETVRNRTFYLHISLKYGLVEMIIGVMDENKNTWKEVQSLQFVSCSKYQKALRKTGI